MIYIPNTIVGFIIVVAIILIAFWILGSIQGIIYEFIKWIIKKCQKRSKNEAKNY